MNDLIKLESDKLRYMGLSVDNPCHVTVKSGVTAVIGANGSGKSTQIANLRRMFAERNIPTEYLHFPRFDAPFFGELIARFLRGELGGVDAVDPYLDRKSVV